MKFVADESVERPISRALEKLGHEVWEICAEASGVSDRRMLELTREKQAILLTADKDFGDLIYIEREIVRGAVLFRLQGLPLHAMVERAVKAIEAHLDELERSFLVVGQRQVRIRPLPAHE